MAKRFFNSNPKSVFSIVSSAKTSRTTRHGVTKPQEFRTKLQRATYSEDWATLRKEVLERDGYRCRACGKNLRGEFHRHIHHIVPLARGGTNKKSNLVSLCVSCHEKEHRR